MQDFMFYKKEYIFNIERKLHIQKKKKSDIVKGYFLTDSSSLILLQ